MRTNRFYRLLIDPGHGGKDCGAIGPDGIKEKDIVLQIGQLFKRAITQGDYLYYAYLTRFSDRYLTLAARCKLAKERKTDLFISLHCNSVARVDPEGMEVWYKRKCKRSVSLAAELYLSLLNLMPGISGRGVKSSADAPHGSLYVLENVDMPAALIEFEFLSNPQHFVSDIEDQRRIVKGLAETVEEFLESGEFEV
jgi:N-acetylmuramoyl-L-alanine amidase